MFLHLLSSCACCFVDLTDTQERVSELAQLISQLPLPNYSLLRALTAHLILIVQNASVNKMTMRNVGIVFSPTLGIPAGVFSLMLGEFNRVFNVDGDTSDTNVPASTDSEPNANTSDPIPIQKNRNSRSYADGAADKMLGLAGRSLKRRYFSSFWNHEVHHSLNSPRRGFRQCR